MGFQSCLWLTSCTSPPAWCVRGSAAGEQARACQSVLLTRHGARLCSDALFMLLHIRHSSVNLKTSHPKTSRRGNTGVRSQVHAASGPETQIVCTGAGMQIQCQRGNREFPFLGNGPFHMERQAAGTLSMCMACRRLRFQTSCSCSFPRLSGTWGHHLLMTVFLGRHLCVSFPGDALGG